MKFIEIEKLRAVAVLMVVILHMPYLHSILPDFLKNSAAGVDLFFAISGFVVTLSLLRQEKKFTSPDDSPIENTQYFLKIFYTKRALRIIPAALFWIATYFIFTLIYKNSASQSLFGTPKSILKEATYIFSGCYNYLRYNTQNMSVYNLGFYWSLCVEAHFYFLLPFLFILTKNKKDRIKIILFLIITVVCFLRPFLASPANYNEIAFNNFASHRRFDVLLFGVLAAQLYKEKSNYQIITNAKILFGNFLSIFLILGIWILPGVLPYPFNLNFGFSIVGVYCVFLVFLASKNCGYVLNIPLLNHALSYLGSRSYSIYLSHVLAIAIALSLEKNISLLGIPLVSIKSIVIGLSFLLILIFSELSFQICEKPFQSSRLKII